MLIPEPNEKMLDIHAQHFRITLFFQDPMSGIFDYHVKESGVNTKSYYQTYRNVMKECAKKTGKYQLLFSFL